MQPESHRGPPRAPARCASRVAPSIDSSLIRCAARRWRSAGPSCPRGGRHGIAPGWLGSCSPTSVRRNRPALALVPCQCSSWRFLSSATRESARVIGAADLNYGRLEEPADRVPSIPDVRSRDARRVLGVWPRSTAIHGCLPGSHRSCEVAPRYERDRGLQAHLGRRRMQRMPFCRGSGRARRAGAASAPGRRDHAHCGTVGEARDRDRRCAARVSGIDPRRRPRRRAAGYPHCPLVHPFAQKWLHAPQLVGSVSRFVQSPLLQHV